MKYSVIIADPAWGFNDALKSMKDNVKRSAQSQYVTMSLADIKAMPVSSVVEPSGTILALWVPSTMLPDGLDVMTAWGFTFKTTVCWVKQSANKKLGFGMGRLFRGTHEIALIGTIGKVLKSLQNKSQRSAFLAQNEGHSCKPENLHVSLELMFPDAHKLELFSRRPREGWTCLGNAIDGKDITCAVNELAITP